MSQSQEKWTLEDADDNSKIKREAGSEMARVASANNPELFKHFEKVCRDMGREPWEVLGDMLVKSMENDQYSEALFNIEVDVSRINQTERRIDDAKFIMDLKDELGIGEEDEEETIRDAIAERIKSQVDSPVPRLAQGRRSSSETDTEVKERINRIEEKIDNLSSSVERTPPEQRESGEKKDIDELFEDSGEDEEELEDIVEEVEEQEDTGLVSSKDGEYEDE